MTSESVEPPSWVNLLTLLVHGPDAPVRGIVRRVDDEDAEVGWFAYGSEDMPVFAGMRGGAAAGTAPEAPLRIWRDGQRLRVEELDGSVNLIADETTCWQWEQGSEVPYTAPRENLRLALGALELLERRTAEHFLGDDFTKPAGPVGATTYLDRRAWTVELAPPSHKPHPLHLVIDPTTGMVLQERNDGFGSRTEWLEFETSESLPAELFRWEGPIRERAIWQQESDDRMEEDLAERREWFTANVAALPLAIEFTVDVHVHGHDEDGTFEASFDRGSLARRPRSDLPWDLHWSSVDHRWSTTRWDWALTTWDGPMTTRGLALLKAQLDDDPGARP